MAAIAEPRELYLDLLVRAVANTIYPEPSILPSHLGQPTNPALRLNGHDWPAMAHSMAGVTRLTNLRTLAQRCIDDGIPGHFIETGVWRGGSCILMRGVLAANGSTDRKVFVADSFAGLPPPQVPQDAGSRFHNFKELAVSEQQVRENFSRYDLLDDQVVFVKGFFQDTLPTLDVSPFALLRLDGDMYESTDTALRALYPRLSPGGFIIIDDYGALGTCKMAVDEFREKNGITAPLHTIDWTGRWWRKD